jgi:hypothetical protein
MTPGPDVVISTPQHLAHRVTLAIVGRPMTNGKIQLNGTATARIKLHDVTAPGYAISGNFVELTGGDIQTAKNEDTKGTLQLEHVTVADDACLRIRAHDGTVLLDFDETPAKRPEVTHQLAATVSMTCHGQPIEITAVQTSAKGVSF